MRLTTWVGAVVVNLVVLVSITFGSMLIATSTLVNLIPALEVIYETFTS